MVENMFNKELLDVSFDIEALDEWKATAKELGMEGQLGLTKDDNSPIPYPFMNESMKRVYETLCPNKTHFIDYKNTTIPLDVLKQISFSVKEKHFNEIYIWADDKEPDPLAVGMTYQWYNNARDAAGHYLYFSTKKECENHPDNSNNAYRTNEKFYIIARWGDELRDYAELKKLAIKRTIENIGGELERAIAIKNEKLKLVKENSKSYINGNISRYEIEGH